ncbi:CLI_3235 family bacteriocin precursor [Enterococcus sp. CSURQ0835]|uniref:CLI_3235 family bacteriocin precursor n=1 Tax=Enterococcus sp. CSURQ0835 TaxID=2681394 RepID=UPI00135870B9|nr:CLI_3235 family bacteriocin precursor [Enterococcus sp. CSURQ0835]
MLLGKRRKLSMNSIEAYACNCSCAANCSCSCWVGFLHSGGFTGNRSDVQNRNARGASGNPKM